MREVLLATAVLAAALLILAVAEPSDPRCAGVTCKARWTPDFTSDRTTCAYGACPKCLVGEDWDARRAELGTGLATRSFTPSLVFGNWLTTELAETAFRILAEEMLGYTIDPLPTLADGYDILCCNASLVYLEKWPEDVYPPAESAINASLTQLSAGYEGGSSLYVSRHTLDAYPLATAYNAYKYLPEYQNIFPRAFSTPCIEATINASLGCVEGNYMCNLNKWTNTTCGPQGRYVPPQCQPDPSKCQEIFLMHPQFDAGFFEALIKNTGLMFVAVYIEKDRLVDRLLAMRARGEHALYYAWEPDPVVALLNSQQVIFKTPTIACRSRRHPDPTLSRADCDFGRDGLLKVAQTSRLAIDPDFRFFFESFGFSGTDMLGMLKQHVEGGGTKYVYNISCEWLQNNYATWKSWIRNTPDPSPAPTLPPQSPGVNGMVVGVAVGVSVGVITVLVIVAFFVRRQRLAAKLRHAPRNPPLAIVMTDVESSTTLWEHYGPHMAAAMEFHHACIRELIEENCGFEVLTAGDAFTIAFNSLIDAMMLALAIQRRLNEFDWPAPLKQWKNVSEAEEGPREVWNGLRVRIGVHYCTDVTVQFDTVHGNFVYAGRDAHITNRVQGIAQGGQVMINSETFKQLTSDPEFSTAIGEDAVITRFAAGVELKDVSEKVTLYSCVPSNLVARRFKPIEGAEDPMAGSTLQRDDSNSEIASNHSGTQGVSNVANVTRGILAALPNQKARVALVTELLQSRKIEEAGTYPRRVKALIRSLEKEARVGGIGAGGGGGGDDLAESLAKSTRRPPGSPRKVESQVFQ